MDASHETTSNESKEDYPRSEDYYKKKWQEENHIRQLLLTDYNIC